MSKSAEARGALENKDVDLEVGLKLHVRHLKLLEGASTIVFLHDSLGSIALWRHFPESLCLATGCNGLIYDRQGHGKSCGFSEPRTPTYLHKEAAILDQLLTQEKVERAVLFGHSDGGSIALIAAALHPQRILGVISEGAHVFVEEITLAGIRAAQEQLTTTNLKERVARYHGAKTDAVFSAWIDTWLSAEYRDFNMEALLPLIKCPVLAIQGVDDEFGTVRQVEAIVSQAGGRAIGKIIDHARHSPHKEAAAVTLQLVADFVKSITG
jgi:pimeloyl-ACP methyl ester carboxylesterase